MKKSDLKKLYNAGLISAKPYNYFELKNKFKQYRAQGLNVHISVKKVSQLTGKSERSIYRALAATKDIKLED